MMFIVKVVFSIKIVKVAKLIKIHDGYPMSDYDQVLALKASENFKVFWFVQSVRKGCIGK